MQSIATFLLKHESFRRALQAAGWLNPATAEGFDELRRIGWIKAPVPQGGGAPSPPSPKGGGAPSPPAPK